jgi:tRNA threonylcarbamoyladenosine biosynthesis protein TsaB
VTKKKNQAQGPTGLPPARRILALETATDVSSVALFEDGRLVAIQENHAHRTHARLVTVMIERLFSDMEWEPTALGAVVVAKGPGSYTGLRVGVSVAKGMAMALDIPLLSLGSLEALACAAAPVARVLGARICPLIDARRMEVFTQAFDQDAQPLSQPEAVVVDAGAFGGHLAAGPVLFVGDGAAKCKPLFADNPRAIFLEGSLSSAAHLGARADLLLQSGRHEDLITFEPFYLKEFVATLSNKKML